MKPNYASVLNESTPNNAAIRITPKFLCELKSSDFSTRRISKSFASKPNKAKKTQIKKKLEKNLVVKNDQRYLNIEVIRNMLNKFLGEKKIEKKILAQNLNITTEELERLLSRKTVSELIAKINLPLIKLFCETKFNN